MGAQYNDTHAQHGERPQEWVPSQSNVMVGISIYILRGLQSSYKKLFE